MARYDGFWAGTVGKKIAPWRDILFHPKVRGKIFLSHEITTVALLYKAPF